MSAPSLLTLTDRIGHAARVHGVLALPWERRGRARLRALLASGEAVTLAMPHGSRLRHGDLLRGDDGRVVRVVAAPEPTYALRSPDPAVLARCALLLGRRRIAAMGADVHEELAPFEPEAEPPQHGGVAGRNGAPALDIDGA